MASESDTAALRVEQPPLPPLSWDGHDWAGEATLASWAGFQSRQGAYAGRDRSGPSDGHVQLSVGVREGADGAECGEPSPPTPAQVAAYEFLQAHEVEVAAAVLAAVRVEYPAGEHGMPWLDSAEELRAFVGLAIVHVLPVERDGVAYLGFELGCAWDEEHGVGVLVHRGEVVEVGDADTSFDEARAGRDAEEAAPPRWSEVAGGVHPQRWRRGHADAVPRAPIPKDTAMFASWAVAVLGAVGAFFWSVRAGLGAVFGLVAVVWIAVALMRRLDAKRPWPFRLPDHWSMVLVVPAVVITSVAAIALLLWGRDGAAGAASSGLWLVAPIAGPVLRRRWCAIRTSHRLERALALGAPIERITRSRCVTDTFACRVAHRLVEHGRWQEAIELVERTLGTAMFRYEHLAVWIDAALALGDVAEAERAWRRSVNGPPCAHERELAALLDARTTLAHGDPALALALTAGGAAAGPTLVVHRAVLRADALVVAGRHGEAQAVLDELRVSRGDETLAWLARQRRPSSALAGSRRE